MNRHFIGNADVPEDAPIRLWAIYQAAQALNEFHGLPLIRTDTSREASS
jgi:hypothetical protein